MDYTNDISLSITTTTTTNRFDDENRMMIGPERLGSTKGYCPEKVNMCERRVTPVLLG